MRLSPARLGFRGRLVAALVLSSAVTLLVAGATLLPPLQHRLRADAEHSLRAHAKATAPAFAALAPGNAERRSRALAALAARLHRRAGARVIVTSRGRTLVDTDVTRRPGDPPPPPPPADSIRVTRPERIGGRRAALELAREPGVLEGVVSTVRRSLLEAALIGFLVSIALGVLVARRLLRRLEALREATHSIAAGGTVTLPPEEGSDELGDLTRAFALMQARLARQEEARRTFVSTASHELRTPLASLAVMLELAAEDLAPGQEWPERAREQVDRARGQTERLATLADQLLNLSRLDAGVELRAERVELGAVARSVAAELGVRAAAGSLAVDVEGEGTAVGDLSATAQIVRILLDNALRFAPPGTTIDVSVAPERDGTIALTVADAGRGVPLDEAALIFARFARGRVPGGSAGFGLGLAIARELAERMGGRLELTTHAPVGARLVLELPAAVPQNPQPEVSVPTMRQRPPPLTE